MILNPKMQKRMNRLAQVYYLINMVGYVYAALHPSFRVGILTGVLVTIMAVFALLNRWFESKYYIPLLFLSYSIMTIICALAFDYPFSLYFRGFIYNLLPVSFFFIQVIDLEKLYKWIFNSLLACLIIGYIFYLTVPDSYVTFLYNGGHIGALYKDLANVNMQGLFGLTITGSFSCCCVLYFFSQWIVKKKWLDFIKGAFCIYLLFIVGRRSAIGACLILLIVCNIVYYNEFKTIRLRQVFILSVLVVIAIIGSSQLLGLIFPTLDRVMNVTGAVSERSWNWKANIQQMNVFSWIFGKGIGTSGHMATALGYLGVNDNSYLLLIAEEGIVGIGIFLIIVIQQFAEFFQKKGKIVEEYVSFFIVLVFMIQAFGSNVWEFPILSVLFWLALSNCSWKQVSDYRI